jgi:HlyD family secretion protein
MKSHEGDPRRAIRRLNLVGATAIAIGIGGAGGWAATTHIAGAVIASGNLVVESNVKKVQHNSGGIVGEIPVKDGDAVEAGQIVMRLDDTLTRANLGVVQSQLDVFMARQARLTAERDQDPAITFPEALVSRLNALTVAMATLGEAKLFEARRKGREGQHSQLRERLVQTENEIRGLSSQQEAKEKENKFIGEELDGVSRLYKQNLVTIVRYNALQRDQARLHGERGQLIAEIARAHSKIAETEIQILQLDQEFRTEVLKELRETQARIAELQERVNAAVDELKRIDIRAPEAGIVHQLSVHTVGGVIGRGDTVMLIVPKTDALIIEAKVAPPDIDQVIIGAAVSVRIAAANRRTTPDLEGVVKHISPDLTREQQTTAAVPMTQAYYLVRVTLDELQLKRLKDLQLLAGMPVEVFIRTHDRTPLDYLVKPLTEQIARTFRER